MSLGHIFLLIPAIVFWWQTGRKNWDKRNEGIGLGFSSICLILLVFIGALSLLWNQVGLVFALKNTLKLKYFFFGVAGVAAFQRLFDQYLDQKKIRFLIHLLLITTSLASITGLIALETGWNYLRFKQACHPTRNCGMYGMYMTYGYGIGLFQVLLTGMLLYRNKIKDYCHLPLLYAAFSINLVGLMLSFCRGAIIGYFLCLPFFFLRRKRKVVAYLTLGLVSVGLSLFLFNSKVRELFLNAQRLESNQIRVSQFKAVWEVFKEKPWLGLGYKNFEPNSSRIKREHKIEFAEFTGHAHNNFMEHLGSTGIFGVLALLGFHIFWFRESWKRNDVIGDLMMPFIVALFISGQFQYTLGDGENLFLVMYVYSLSHIQYRHLKREGGGPDTIQGQIHGST